VSSQPMGHGEQFLALSRDYLTEDYVPQILACLHQLSEADVWWRGNEASNSIGNLVLHLAGNARQWIVAGVGGAPDTRNRADEFSAGTGSVTDLIGHFERVMAEVDGALARITPAELSSERKIQGIETTVMGAIYHVVEHFSTHTGQIVLLTKLRLGRDLGFWQIGPDGSARQTWRSR
jgi:uncharacterized damage-inducible protein DinB